MTKNLFATFFSRIVITLSGFLVVTLNAHFLGAEGVGTIGLIVLSISVIQLLNSIIGSGALIYLISRYPLTVLLVIAYVWAVVSAIVGSLILWLIPGALPAGYIVHIFLLSILQAFFTTNLSAIMGLERYKQFNLFSVLQMVVLLAAVGSIYFVMPTPNVHQYLIAMYASGAVTFILTFFALCKSMSRFSGSEVVSVIKSVAGFGSWIQLASVFQFFNYRLNYYFIENILSRAALGVYSVGAQISESSWIVSRSIAMVQYSRISNARDNSYAGKLTLALLKLAMSLTFCMIIIFLIIPTPVYSFVFTNEFSKVKLVIITMSIGIMAVAFSTIMSHYFSGTGKPYHNTIASGIGFLSTLIAGLLLIPSFGLQGAGFTASIAYTSSAVYQMIVFLKVSGSGAGNLLVSQQDLTLWRTELKKLISGKE